MGCSVALMGRRTSINVLYPSAPQRQRSASTRAPKSAFGRTVTGRPSGAKQSGCVELASLSFQAIPSSPYVCAIAPVMSAVSRTTSPPPPSCERASVIPSLSLAHPLHPLALSFYPFSQVRLFAFGWCLRLGRVKVEAFSRLSQMAAAAVAEIADIFSFSG